VEIQHDVGRLVAHSGGRDGDQATGALALALVDDLNAVAEWRAVVQLILNRAVMETRSDRGVISWIDGDEMIVAGCQDPLGELVEIGSRWPLASDQVTAMALAAGKPEAGSFGSPDIAGISPGLRATYAELRNILVVPVSVAGEAIAVLCVCRRRSQEFTRKDCEVLDVIASVGAQPLRAARLDDMLGAALAALAERLASAESVERIKTDILRLASHELRSPLTVLHGYLSLVRAGHFGELPEPLGQVMTILDRRTEEMKGLVNDMLAAVKGDAGRADVARTTVDLRTVVREAADAVEPPASGQHRVRVHLPDQPLYVRVDSGRVLLALRNIIDNAVKYSPNGEEVECSLAAVQDGACVRIADHGLGIAPEDRDHLFTRFGRVVTTANSHIQGIGLGLYFARAVARRHGGDVTLVDGDGPGSVFELTLPLRRDDPA
jgi:signal transduction histidine kinase